MGVRSMFRNEARESVPVDLNKLITTVLRIVHADLAKHGVILRTLLDDELPMVIGDPVQLQQVILNLIINGIESMSSEQTRLLGVRSERTGQRTVLVSVADTGSGVDPSNRDRIFKALFTTKTGGMGMGLAICHSIIESHRGKISVAPATGGGSVFQFELPSGDASEAQQ